MLGDGPAVRPLSARPASVQCPQLSSQGASPDNRLRGWHMVRQARVRARASSSLGRQDGRPWSHVSPCLALLVAGSVQEAGKLERSPRASGSPRFFDFRGRPRVHGHSSPYSKGCTAQVPRQSRAPADLRPGRSRSRPCNRRHASSTARWGPSAHPC